MHIKTALFPGILLDITSDRLYNKLLRVKQKGCFTGGFGVFPWETPAFSRIRAGKRTARLLVPSGTAPLWACVILRISWVTTD
jgi:hypothetical protein